MAPRRPVLLVAGPTCAGKSAWCMALAAREPVEIVSVDSAQVFRGFDIGTAKPDAAVRARVPHHLLDLCDGSDVYDAGRFVEDAGRAIQAIQTRGSRAVLVGGTMLYFRALTRGLVELPRANRALRRELDLRARREGWAALHAELATLDPPSANRIAPNDSQRIQRALEVLRLTGAPLSAALARAPVRTAPFEFERWALMPSDRAALHRRIDGRLHEMLGRGWLDELRRLGARRDLHFDMAAMRSVGYRQMWDWQQGRVPLEVALASAAAATRRLAKRQMTWIRGEPEWQLIDPDRPGALDIWLESVASGRLRNGGNPA